MVSERQSQFGTSDYQPSYELTGSVEPNQGTPFEEDTDFAPNLRSRKGLLSLEAARQVLADVPVLERQRSPLEQKKDVIFARGNNLAAFRASVTRGDLDLAA